MARTSSVAARSCVTPELRRRAHDLETLTAAEYMARYGCTRHDFYAARSALGIRSRLRSRAWWEEHAGEIAADGPAEFAARHSLSVDRCQQMMARIGAGAVRRRQKRLVYDRRNAEILRRVESGETQAAIADDLGLTHQRISQIVAAERERRAGS